MKFWTLLLAFLVLFASADADAARRLGGGGSVGRQSSHVTQREASRPPSEPAGGSAVQQRPQQPAAQPGTPPVQQPAAQPARSRWGGMLGGLAAGLGLAWLAHSLGLGQGFANLLLVLLVGLVLFAVFGAMMRSRRPQPAYGGAAGASPADVAAAPPQYNPAKIGNDASARPWERNSMAFEAKPAEPGGLRIGSALAGSQSWGVPEGFDVQGFLASAKRNFISLQAAWDKSDLATLRAMMTDEMLTEIRNQLAERERQSDGRPNHTDVVMLEAQLLGIEETSNDYLASVEFSGMIREDASAGPSPFREVWNMAKPKDGSSGWLVAGVQALQ
jgi:predicted lipid-binding transport protein (Tim44 family)